MPTDDLSRRAVVRGATLTAVAGAAGFVVARRSDAAKATSATTAANAYGAPAAAQGSALVAVDRIPDGGGVVLESRHVVVTKDATGTVRGFSATCTHQGCTVSSVDNGAISCPCHGSRFDAATGAVVQGPATRALAAVPVVVRDGNVFAG
jgi:Rieske Fe-S protein